MKDIYKKHSLGVIHSHLTNNWKFAIVKIANLTALSSRENEKGWQF